MQSIDNLDSLAERLLEANQVGALTGAGMSKESGIQTFREKDGLWKKFRPEELANVDAFLANPDRVWEWYNWRRDLMSNVKPNPGHYALAELDDLISKFILVTQNIDNLHNEVGSKHVIELHGNIRKNKCQSCKKPFETGWLDFSEGKLPHCDCGGLIRPDVVWFGEMLPSQAIEDAWQAAAKSDVYFSIGTSTVVYPAAALPFEAKIHGAYLIEINPDRTDLSSIADLVIRMPSGEALPQIIEAVQKRKDQS
ncbi:MAG: NAD-dependent deacylase [Candidatus Electryonea clarkiae]|nr:NAD-dependent deacylase [Candidatus Electryonea clarkiae]MDP8288087.1 NAD-dependent deacylase [Candidatus Electryonea clarkiae]